jgi:U3 small nucleolar RNA-associated protein 13
MLATGGDDGQVRVWDLVTRSCVATLKAHFSAVTSLAVSPDGWTLLSGGRDAVVVAWSLRDYSKTATVPVYEAVEGVVALPQGAAGFPGVPAAGAGGPPPLCFATGGDKGRVKLWRADTAQCVYDGAAQGGGAPAAAGGIVALRSLGGGGGGGVVAATQDCRLLVLRPEGGRLNLARQLIGNNDEVTDVRFVCAGAAAPAEPTHLAVATNSEHIRLFDAATLGCTATLVGHTDIVLCLDAARLPGGRTLLASGSKDAGVRVWTAPEGRCVGVGAGHVAAVGAVAFSRRGGGFLVSGGADKLLKVWDVGSLALDEEKDAAAAAAPARMRVTAAVAAHDKDVNAVAVAPNDSLVATGSQDRTAKVWRLPDLVPALTLRGHKRGVWAVAFSPVDQALATASGDKTVRLWGLRDGSCLRTFEGHLASVLRAEFLSAGAQLLTAGADGLLKLWSVRTSECVNTFDAADDKVWALAVGAGGAAVATGGGDGSLALWEDCTAADAEGAAAEREGAALREQELSNALAGRDWGRAAALALEMRQPGRLLGVVTRALEAAPAGAGEVLGRVVGGLDGEGLRLCLEYCREWNTNARTCAAAQATLQAVLRRHPPAAVLAVPGVAALLEGLAPYTQRHLARADRLVRSTYVVDYVLGAMHVLTPEEANGGEEGGEVKANGGGGGEAPSSGGESPRGATEAAQPGSGSFKVASGRKTRSRAAAAQPGAKKAKSEAASAGAKSAAKKRKPARE